MKQRREEEEKAAPDKCHSRRAFKFIQQLSLHQAQTHPSHLISYIKTLREMSGQITVISAQPLTLKDSECADTCTVYIAFAEKWFRKAHSWLLVLLVHVLLVIMGQLKVARVAQKFNEADMKIIRCDNGGLTKEHKTAYGKIQRFSRFY